jgi:transcriptional regulator with PAS, ATPase and Fis domain
MTLRWVYPALQSAPLVDGLVFGRDPSAGSFLSGAEASRRHAVVAQKPPLPTLRDLGSRNGTWVNGKRITERHLGPADVVRIGEWVGVVVEAPEDPAALEFRDLGHQWYGSAKLAAAIEPLRRVASTDLPVIVQGETGTGKEGMARALHAWSGRSGAFLAVNCGAIPPAMAEGELFGYRRGAFTGADRNSPGFFRTASGGTLLLDEVLDLPPEVQTKLLRVLEQREIHALGEPLPTAIDTRIVCATQESLATAVAQRRFRADLLARLDGLTVVLPPLRERREDIVPLFQRCLSAQSGGRAPQLDSKLVETLLLYDWPLNVRELILLVRRLLAVHAQEPILKKSALPDRMLAPHPPRSRGDEPPGPPTAARAATTDEAAFDQLVSALRQHHGNVTRAAAALGLSRSRAYRLLEARPDFDVRSLRPDPSPTE